MSFPLTPEQTMLVESVRAFVEKELYPHEDLVEKLDDVPEELARDIQTKALRGGLICRPKMAAGVSTRYRSR